MVFNGGEISCTLPLLEITRSWGMEITRWRGDTRAKRVSAPFTRFRVNYANMGFIGFYRPMSRPRSIVLKLMLNMAENLPSLSMRNFFFFWNLNEELLNFFARRNFKIYHCVKFRDLLWRVGRRNFDFFSRV